MNKQVCASRLSEVRQMFGLSQNKFGKLVNLPQPTISRLELARSCPRVSTMHKLALAIDVSPSFIMGESDEMFL